MRRRGQRGRGTRDTRVRHTRPVPGTRRSRGAVRRRRLTHSAEAGPETATGSLQRSHRRAATVKRRRRHRPRRKFSVVPPRDSAPSCRRAAVPSAASPVPPTSAGTRSPAEGPRRRGGDPSHGGRRSLTPAVEHGQGVRKSAREENGKRTAAERNGAAGKGSEHGGRVAEPLDPTPGRGKGETLTSKQSLGVLGDKNEADRSSRGGARTQEIVA